MKRTISILGLFVLLLACLFSSCEGSLWGDYDNPLDPDNDDDSGDDSRVVIDGLSGPGGLALDGSGRFYVSEMYKSVVSRYDIAAETFNIFAGTPNTMGYFGDGGPATAAQLSNPQGIAFDSLGRLYITDRENALIRRVDAAEFISTVAGILGSFMASGDAGLATAAGIGRPLDVAIGPDDDLYICDGNNFVIRQVDSTTGIISTLAGTTGFPGYSGDGGPANTATLQLGTAAGSNAGSGIDVDSAGNLYIADTGNRVIRMVNIGASISTIAGNGTDSGGTEEGPATAVSLRNPTDVLMANDGTLYIADCYQYTSTYFDEEDETWHTLDYTKGRVCKVVGGMLTNVLISPADDDGDSILNYFCPAALAEGPGGKIYVTDTQQGRVMLVN